MCLWSPRAARPVPGGVLSSSVFYYLYHARPCFSLFIYLQAVCVFFFCCLSSLRLTLLLSITYHPGAHLSFLSLRPVSEAPILLPRAQVYTAEGARASERARRPALACVNVQIRQGAHHSGARERRRQRLLSLHGNTLRM